MLSSHPLLPGIFLILISVKDRVDPRAAMWLEELHQFKNGMTSSGIKSVTFHMEDKLSHIEMRSNSEDFQWNFLSYVVADINLYGTHCVLLKECIHFLYRARIPQSA
jgi:hypothetical protein